MEEYLKDESELAKKLINLDAILELQLTHDIQVVRGSDYNYMCFIDGYVYATCLTPILALAYGCKLFSEAEKIS